MSTGNHPIMPNVVIYTSAICPYCIRAKHLLAKKGVKYEEIRIDLDREQMHEMIEKSRRQTVPQIFIDEYHVGGYDDLATLDMQKKLDPLLGL